MKEAELRRHAICTACSKPIGHSGLPLFWTVSVTRWGVDARALERQQGLAMVTGSAALAMVMGPNEDLAKPIHEPVTLSVCETCAYENPLLMAALAEGEN